MQNKYLVIFFNNENIKFLDNVDISYEGISKSGANLDDIVESVTICDKFKQDNYDGFMYIISKYCVEEYILNKFKNIKHIEYLSKNKCIRISKLNEIFKK